MARNLKLVLITLFLLMGGCSDMSQQTNQSGTLKEASMNFDLSDVEPFLKRISPLVDSGFAESEIHQVQRELAKMEDGDDYEVGGFDIVYQNKETSLIINAFIDSPEAVDLYIDTDPGLAEQIQQEMDKFAEEMEEGY